MPLTRRDVLKALSAGVITLAVRPALAQSTQTRANRLNFLLITADDMNWNTPACFGGKMPNITPNIDALAAQGRCFRRAHVTIAVCQPSRSTLMTGRYPHRNGAEGFQPIRSDVSTLEERLHSAGYINGILGKVSHLAPVEKFHWTMNHDVEELAQGRDPKRYHDFAKEFFDKAKEQQTPFFLMANSHDPHRPFHGSASEKNKPEYGDWPPPSQVFDPEQALVPGFLPDLPDVRKELAQYYSSCRRCDDTVGAVLQALEESGLADNTLVMFLSDNGMSFPFSKTNCYLQSTRTPWIVRWPRYVDPGAEDTEDFISGIDFMPTILEAAGLPPEPEVDGRSFMPLLRGEKQEGRDCVFTQFHETSARRRCPMRCIQNERFGYLYNPWSDGERVFKNESQSGLTFDAMQKAAKDSPGLATRVKFFQYRVLEEFYDFERDPDALNNLIDDPAYQEPIQEMRRRLLEWMRNTGDPAAKAFEHREDAEARRAFMREQDARAEVRGPKEKRRRPKEE